MLAEGDVDVKLHSFVVALTFVPMVILVSAAVTATLVLMFNELSPPTQLSIGKHEQNEKEYVGQLHAQPCVIGTLCSRCLCSHCSIVYHIPFVAEVAPESVSFAGAMSTLISAIVVSVVVAVHVATTKAKMPQRRTRLDFIVGNIKSFIKN